MKEYVKGNQEYTDFVKSGLNVGFTDDQVDFLWSWFETPPVLETPTVKESEEFCEAHGMYKKNCRYWQKQNMLDECPSNSEKEEVKEDTKKGEMLLGVDYGSKDGDKTVKLYGYRGDDGNIYVTREEITEPPKEPVKKPTFLVYDIRGEGATATKVLNMGRSLEVIAKYLNETQ